MFVIHCTLYIDDTIFVYGWVNAMGDVLKTLCHFMPTYNWYMNPESNLIHFVYTFYIYLYLNLNDSFVVSYFSLVILYFVFFFFSYVDIFSVFCVGCWLWLFHFILFNFPFDSNRRLFFGRIVVIVQCFSTLDLVLHFRYKFNSGMSYNTQH